MTHHRHTEADAHAQESTVDLVGGLIGDAKDLAVAHLDGIRLELKGELRGLAASTKYAAAATAVFAVGALLAVLCLAEALWLYTALPSWAAYGAVSAVCFAVGAMVQAARARRFLSKDIDLVPETSIEQLEHDAAWMARRLL